MEHYFLHLSDRQLFTGNPRTYKQSYTPTKLPELLGACDILQDGRHFGRHLGFY